MAGTHRRKQRSFATACLYSSTFALCVNRGQARSHTALRKALRFSDSSGLDTSPYPHLRFDSSDVYSWHTLVNSCGLVASPLSVSQVSMAFCPRRLETALMETQKNAVEEREKREKAARHGLYAATLCVVLRWRLSCQPVPPLTSQANLQAGHAPHSTVTFSGSQA